jgi:hypothetical protein
MWQHYLGLAVVMIAVMEASLSAQDVNKCPVKLNPSTAVRDTTLMITVANPPNVAEGTVQLRRQDFTSPPAPVTLNAGTIAYSVPKELPLGQYSVIVTLNNTSFAACEWLHVVPAPKWEVKLSPFEPNATYDTETVWVPDAPDPAKGRKLQTVRLALRGSGFLVETPGDNRILINGDAQPVTWDTCTTLPDAGTSESPKPNEIHGQVISSERIDLCRVPVPPHGAIRLAVKQGDMVTEPPQKFSVYRWPTWQVAGLSAVIALVLGLVVLWFVHLLNRTQPIESRHNALQVLFLDLETDTYSLSKFQFYCWTAAALFGYAYLVFSKMWIQREAWPDLPGTLPGIVAIGAGTSVGAQFVTSVRGPKGSGTEKPSLGDLVTSGGVAAPERVQMLVWTLFGVGIFCLAVLQHAPDAIRDLDAVPTNMLYMMGLSAVGYLGGKLARKPGPVINEISITPAESDEAVASAAAPPPLGPPNLSQPVAQAQGMAQDIAQKFPGVPTGNAQTAVNALSTGITAASQAKTTDDAAAVVTKLTELRSQAEMAAKTAADEFAQPGAQPEAARVAEIAQRAAAALQTLSAAISATVAATLAPPLPGAAAGPKFTRVIELRGRNLSSEALIELNGVELPFRMLQMDGDGHRRPEVVIREPDDQTLARVLRLSIDPGQLEAPDFKQYKDWFGTSDTRNTKTFTLINLDGQKSDISFTVPPATAQSSVKTGQEPQGGAPKP